MMADPRRIAGAVLVLALAAPAAAAAQAPPPMFPYQPPSPADDRYVAPRIPKAGLDVLARLPNFDGMWSGDRYPGLRVFCATCADFYAAPDPAPADAVGRNPSFPPGSKDLGIPYKPEYMKLYDERIAAAKRGVDHDPDNCMAPHPTPDAMTTAFDTGGGVDIWIRPHEVRMTWDWLNGTRRIYTDGRPHPGVNDLFATHMGHSIGRWEGDTLVVDTVGMLPGNYDQTAAPYSDQIHMVERIRLIGKDKLENVITVEDPVMLEKPFTVRRTYTRVPLSKTAIIGAYCSDPRDSNSSVPASLIK
jgi:hypothetical protein